MNLLLLILIILVGAVLGLAGIYLDASWLRTAALMASSSKPPNLTFRLFPEPAR